MGNKGSWMNVGLGASGDEQGVSSYRHIRSAKGGYFIDTAVQPNESTWKYSGPVITDPTEPSHASSAVVDPMSLPHHPDDDELTRICKSVKQDFDQTVKGKKPESKPESKPEIKPND